MIDSMGWTGSLCGVTQKIENEVQNGLLHTEKILADRKTFYIDLKENARGRVVKITEEVDGNSDTIMVPVEILDDIIHALKDVKAASDQF